MLYCKSYSIFKRVLLLSVMYFINILLKTFENIELIIDYMDESGLFDKFQSCFNVTFRQFLIEMVTKSVLNVETTNKAYSIFCVLISNYNYSLLLCICTVFQF